MSIDAPPRYPIDEALGVVLRRDASRRSKHYVVSTGKSAKNGINGKYTFEIDLATRIWKERSPAQVYELAPE